MIVPSSVAAHGLAPRALAPLLRDERGLALLRLSRGLALRADDGFHYFCPAHWDGYESDPVAAFAGGPAVIALPSGLFTIERDGSTALYPESGLGSIVALTTSPGALYALALRDDRYELRRLERDHSQLLWSAPQSAGDWLALGAGEHSLVLLGLVGTQLTQLELNVDGTELARGRADVGYDALSVEARIVGDSAYAIVQSESGDRIELGRVTDMRWLSLAQAVGNLSGPVQTADGKRLIALDGALVTFDAERPGAPGDGEFVTTLASYDGSLYASVRDGLRELSGAQLGGPVFDFATLRGPLPGRLPPAEQTACETAWQHLQVDLVAAGLHGMDIVTDPGVASVLDASVPVPHAAPDASATTRVDAGSAPAPHHDAAAPTAPAHPGRAQGCTLSVTAASGPARGGSSRELLLTLAGLLLWRARRRRRSPPRAAAHAPRRGGDLTRCS